MLYNILSYSALIGFSVFVICSPLNKWLGTKDTSLRYQLSEARDTLTSVVNEMVSAIKPIKLFAWEQRWLDRAMEARMKELKILLKSM